MHTSNITETEKIVFMCLGVHTYTHTHTRAVNLQDKAACAFIPTTWEAEAGEFKTNLDDKVRPSFLPTKHNTSGRWGRKQSKNTTQ